MRIVFASIFMLAMLACTVPVEENQNTTNESIMNSSLNTTEEIHNEIMELPADQKKLPEPVEHENVTSHTKLNESEDVFPATSGGSGSRPEPEDQPIVPEDFVEPNETVDPDVNETDVVNQTDNSENVTVDDANTTVPENDTTPTKRLLAETGGRVDWSHANNMITYDAVGSDGYYDVYVIQPDGTGKRCLTCNHSQLSKNNGNPAWHPGGEYIVFQGQTQPFVLVSNSAKPGGGIGSNLFLISKDGLEIWQLTEYDDTPYGVLHPHFSHDGSMLAWGEFQNPDLYYGVWQLQVADFSLNTDPKISNIQSFQPGPNPRFLENGGFSPGDDQVVFTANPDSQAPSGFDIYSIDLLTATVTRLTFTPLVWDEFPHYRPGTDDLYYVSNQEQTGERLKLDLWRLGNHEKITNFHDPEAEEYVGTAGSGIQDYSFNENGSSIVAYVNQQFPDDENEEAGAVYVLDLD